MNKTSSRLYLVIRWVILLLVLVAIYLPLLMIIIYSFSSAQSVGDEFGNFTFRLYAKLFENTKMLSALKNTYEFRIPNSELKKTS